MPGILVEHKQMQTFNPVRTGFCLSQGRQTCRSLDKNSASLEVP